MNSPLLPLMGPMGAWPMGPSAQPDGPRADGRPGVPQPGEPGGPVPVNDAHRYAFLRGEIVAAVNNGSSLLILAQNDVRRNMMLVRNSSATANLYISFGTQATLNSPLYLTPNQMVLFDTVVPQDDVYAYGDAAGAQITLAFSTFL